MFHKTIPHCDSQINKIIMILTCFFLSFHLNNVIMPLLLHCHFFLVLSQGSSIYFLSDLFSQIDHHVVVLMFQFMFTILVNHHKLHDWFPQFCN